MSRRPWTLVLCLTPDCRNRSAPSAPCRCLGRPDSPKRCDRNSVALVCWRSPAEVRGLEVDDVSLDRDTVTFRPNVWRRLKNEGSARVVPLWPQLREVLEQYLAKRPAGRLLFPSYCTGKEAMLTDARKLLDAVATRIGYEPRDLNLYTFRHTYCAARLQTLDRGVPVSPFTVGASWGTVGMRWCGRFTAT